MIDYYSRYLLALHLTPSYSALEASHALRRAVQEAERVHGPLMRPVFLVTDNGPSAAADSSPGGSKPRWRGSSWPGWG